MSRVYFISDLHFGHRNVLNFSAGFRDGNTVEEHDEILMAKINSVVGKRDTLYVLGDLILSRDVDFDILKRINGSKYLVRGNHDDRKNALDYLGVFKDVFGLVKYKKHWLSHAPIHPDELRGKDNIHGHVHTNSIRKNTGFGSVIDDRYLNVCVEALDGFPVSYDDILSGRYKNIRRC